VFTANHELPQSRHPALTKTGLIRNFSASWNLTFPIFGRFGSLFPTLGEKEFKP
jgi:hypothetical protein